MASLFGWATSLVSSTTSVIKDAVVSAVVSDSNKPVIVPPVNKKPLPGQKCRNDRTRKKQVQKKKKEAARKRREVNRQNKGSDSSDTSDDGSDAPNEVEGEQRGEQSGEQRAEGPVESVDKVEGVVGVNEGAAAESEAGSESEDEDGDVEMRQLTPAELAKRERNRKKAQHKREKAKVKKALLATSIVRNMPADPLEAERSVALEEMRILLEKITPISLEDVRLKYDGAARELDNYLEYLDTTVKQLEKKTPRLEVRGVTSQLLKQQIQDIEFSPDRDEAAFVRKIDLLAAAISNEGQRNFVLKVQSLREKAETIRKANQKMLELQKERENKERILIRLKTLKEAASIEADNPTAGGDDIDASMLVSQQYDLQSEQQSALYQPYNLLRRLERRYHVVIEPVQRQANMDTSRRANQGTRFVNIWGLEKDVESIVDFLDEADFSARQKRSYDRRYMGAIIGRSGVGLTQLEELGKAFVYVDGAQDVIVFGTPEGAKAIFDQIEKNKSEVQDVSVSAELPIDPMIARAVISLNRAVIQSVEASTKARVILLSNPSEGVPRVVVRARQDLLEPAKAKVREMILDAYVVLDFPAPNRAINRLLVPPRNVSETAQSRILHEEFRNMRETLGLFIDRYGTRPAEGVVEDDSDSGIKVVCHKSDADDVQTHIADLVERASYTTTRVPIEREQLRKFTPENRALIEATAKCQVSVSSSQAGAYLNLLGSEQAIDAGKKVIAEILQREGLLETVIIDEPDCLNALLRDKAARLRAMEAEHNVSISVYRDTQSAKIVGDETALANCAKAMRDMCAEYKARRAQTETLTIEIEARRVAQLIGRQGATINDIRQTSEVDSINIPQRGNTEVDPESPVCVTIVGLKKNVEIAQKMIERILQIRSQAHGTSSPHAVHQDGETTDEVGEPADDGAEPENPYLGAPLRTSPRGRGRGRGLRTGNQNPIRAPRNVPSRSQKPGDYDEDFPTLPGMPQKPEWKSAFARQGYEEAVEEVNVDL
eukprot:Blabericola_migrator_1__4923@NODE_256_length_10795_cov_202_211130_g214_i0_p1_GENE_NODE_256_length_10795_cov_202_211130_g214_i0NODE_256_length_10795_cov_202_211130_g214_i0_p1_ORF_typecomplete_len1003_score244_15KH_1/PF00013_29/0_0029KH_1/PF00013_29/34KH_1/PF00013_29/1_9e03KH_1/PF00013_29/27KH_1/PF00013_29/3_4e09SLS/PF14611_6/7e02SLS/PF14611_6/6_7SLS/PF14611_6/2SLS/PF14611_6/0_00018SLS/PF14611_6/4_8KH_4/PF13083_6/45KH_4/PF13083_6/0_0011P30/PF07390_11/0_12KH_2/PF07650_17/1e04KH_2/PF07650_17/47KH_2/